jgi:tRNA(Arg) A34 adenosine deaminase TadA
VALPSWLEGVVALDQRFVSEAAVMDAAVGVALANARRGHGPFGAVVVDRDLRAVEVGWNNVVESRDSTAHAEVHALRRAEARLGTHQLRGRGLSLFASCAPCIQCYGAIYWSGVGRVLWAAGKEDAEAIGFLEGPVSADLWAVAARERGIESAPGFHLTPAAREPFRAYRERGGVNYSLD